MFQILIANVLPLYALIAIGLAIGRHAKADVKTVATIMIYAVVPFVMFGAVAGMKPSTEYIIPPLIIAFISATSATICYHVSKIFWKTGNYSNLLGMISIGANATYFGIPIALAIGGQEWFGVYMMMVLPIFILDSTLSYYYGARGHFDMKQSLIRTAKLPIIYGALAGLVWSLSGLGPLPEVVHVYWERFTATTIVIGMLMIGTGLGQTERFRFDFSFFKGVIFSRYLLWPGLGMLSIFIEMNYFNIFPNVIRQFILLICSCPLAANNVAFAAKLELHPALTAMMVTITTIGALAFIPFTFWLAGSLGLIS
jgi:predicted permease